MMVLLPDVVEISAQEPLPEAKVMVQVAPWPSLMLRVPVGIVEAVTVTFTVYGCPVTAGDGEIEVMAVVVTCARLEPSWTT